MRKLVLATRNQGKVREFQRLIQEHSQDIEVISLDSFPELPEIEETGDSFEANALLKAKAVAEFTGLPALADDSGLSVDALNGDPGIYSARWAGAHGDDFANNAKLLNQLSGVNERGAQFKCVVALVIPNESGEQVLIESGSISGVIVGEPRGDFGFGYDPLFAPHGSSLTFGELTQAEKDKISHRGQAFRKIAPRISKSL